MLVLWRDQQDDPLPCSTPLSEPQTSGGKIRAWEGKNPGGVWALLTNPRWERQFVCFLELSGVGRVVEDG